MKFSEVAGSVLKSPISIGRQVLDRINNMAPYFTEYIEEGIKDGSICVKNPKQTAESMILQLKLMYEGIR